MKKVLDPIAQKLLESGEWIIDGYYPRTLEHRLKYADIVFFYDLPKEVCLEGAKLLLLWWK